MTDVSKDKVIPIYKHSAIHKHGKDSDSHGLMEIGSLSKDPEEHHFFHKVYQKKKKEKQASTKNLQLLFEEKLDALKKYHPKKVLKKIANVNQELNDLVSGMIDILYLLREQLRPAQDLLRRLKSKEMSKIFGDPFGHYFLDDKEIKLIKEILNQNKHTQDVVKKLNATVLEKIQDTLVRVYLLYEDKNLTLKQNEPKVQEVIEGLLHLRENYEKDYQAFNEFLEKLEKFIQKHEKGELIKELINFSDHSLSEIHFQELMEDKVFKKDKQIPQSIRQLDSVFKQIHFFENSLKKPSPNPKKSDSEKKTVRLLSQKAHISQQNKLESKLWTLKQRYYQIKDALEGVRIFEKQVQSQSDPSGIKKHLEKLQALEKNQIAVDESLQFLLDQFSINPISKNAEQIKSKSAELLSKKATPSREDLQNLKTKVSRNIQTLEDSLKNIEKQNILQHLPLFQREVNSALKKPKKLLRDLKSTAKDISSRLAPP